MGAGARTIDEYFEDERPRLLPLPEDPFETGRVFTPRVDRYGRPIEFANVMTTPALQAASPPLSPDPSSDPLVSSKSGHR